MRPREVRMEYEILTSKPKIPMCCAINHSVWCSETFKTVFFLYSTKIRAITPLTKVCIIKAVAFPVVMYGCESWTIKKVEHWRIRCFWTVVLEKTLESPWTTRRSNQSILKEISPEYSLEGLMRKLKLQYFGRLMERTDLLEEKINK